MNRIAAGKAVAYMFWRAVTTMVIWISAILMMGFLTDSLAVTYIASYTNMPTSADGIVPFAMPVYETVFAPGGVQVAVLLLCVLTLMAAVGITLAMWLPAHNRQPSVETSLRAEQRHALKHKRETRRRAHALLEHLSDEELEQLEHDYLVDGTGQSIPLEELMAQDQAARSGRYAQP